ncbi:MAG TPA: cytochrome c oxidase assembly protein [Jatrophihabitans sp.]|nr:cytochrome c oxidase assembly protein [Jatrophihabitans sp.]
MARLFTELEPDWWLLVPLLVVAGLYLWGVWRLRVRGDHWPLGRTVAFLLGGIGVIAFAAMSGLGTYDTTMFSLHMIQHMLLAMVAPIFLALGAPVTLALRTVPRRLRSAILAVLHSWLARLLTFPLIGWGLYVASPFALYFTGWYPATLDNQLLHELLHLHFVLVGSLFFWPMVGIDPIPGRQSHPFRFLILVSTLPFHAILGLSIYTQTTVIARAHYEALGLSWLDPLADQRVGGGLLWSSGELVGLIMLGVVTAQWIKASEREAAREDRRLDRLEAAEAAEAAAAMRGATGARPLDTMAVPDARAAGSGKKEVQF